MDIKSGTYPDTVKVPRTLREERDNLLEEVTRLRGIVDVYEAHEWLLRQGYQNLTPKEV